MDNCYCYICYRGTESDFLCDRCDRYYCEQCSYTYTLHYQHQGTRCYSCADQNRLNKLNKIEIRDNKIIFSLDKNGITEPKYEPK
jgi:hypothetical protein